MKRFQEVAFLLTGLSIGIIYLVPAYFTLNPKYQITRVYNNQGEFNGLVTSSGKPNLQNSNISVHHSHHSSTQQNNINAIQKSYNISFQHDDNSIIQQDVSNTVHYQDYNQPIQRDFNKLVQQIHHSLIKQDSAKSVLQDDNNQAQQDYHNLVYDIKPVLQDQEKLIQRYNNNSIQWDSDKQVQPNHDGQVQITEDPVQPNYDMKMQQNATTNAQNGNKIFYTSSNFTMKTTFVPSTVTFVGNQTLSARITFELVAKDLPNADSIAKVKVEEAKGNVMSLDAPVTKHFYKEYPVAKFVNSKLTQTNSLYNLEMNLTHSDNSYFVTLNNRLPPRLSFPLNNPKLCQNNYTEVLMYIISSPGNFDRRQGLRNTWAKAGTWSNHNFSTVFFVGNTSSKSVQRKLEEEFQKYGDIIQIDMIDKYENLTIKGVGVIQWMTTYCSQVKYIIKADDDLAVDIQHIAETISTQIMPDNRVQAKVLCLYCGKCAPIRNPNSKWYVPWTLVPHLRFYPPICLGSFYGYPASLLPRMHQAAMMTPFFWLEDVYFSGFVFPQLQVDEMMYVDIKSLWTITGGRYIERSATKLFFGISVKDAYKYWSAIRKRYTHKE